MENPLFFVHFWKNTSFSVRIGLYIFLEQLLFQETKNWKMVKMAKRVDEVELNEVMMASLIKKLFNEKRKVRQH